ncbi:glycosyltransferase [Dolichospermum circinale]|uniref:glycosyltransferase n=2 Tax=Dolichospermum circinale TaxID=109265 RepID=UPI00232F1C7F|nr:glycosyltransferase [Dolichospermum circinale]
MKICFVTSKIITSHATMKRAFGMANPLTNMGHDVTICLQEAEDNREAMSRCPDTKSYYYHPGSPLYERQQKQAFLEQNSFDVVHICGLGIGNAIVPKFIKNSLVVMDHVELESSIKLMPLQRRLSQGFLEWWSLFVYQGSIVASRYLEFLFRRRLHRFGWRKPILWFPYAYDPDSLIPNDSDIEDLRNQYYGRKIVVYMGGLYKSYGCYEMLEAFHKLADQNSDFVALILGRGPEQDKVREFIQENKLEKWVEFKRYVPEMELPKFLYGADVLLSPLHDTVTDWARCPSKILMYMATKKPIVTCPIGEAWEYLNNDAFYYEPNSVNSMVAAIQKAMSISDSWKPGYDPSQHTWQTRVDSWLDWIYGLKPNFFQKN